MSTGVVVAVATPLAVASAWLLYELGDFGELKPVRILLRWSARILLVIAVLCPPAAAVAFTWFVTQEQERLNEVIIEPIVDHFMPTTTTAPWSSSVGACAMGPQRHPPPRMRASPRIRSLLSAGGFAAP